MRLLAGLMNEPKFSSEHLMPRDMCFCWLFISEYMLFIEPFTPDFTYIGTISLPLAIT